MCACGASCTLIAKLPRGALAAGYGSREPYQLQLAKLNVDFEHVDALSICATIHRRGVGPDICHRRLGATGRPRAPYELAIVNAAPVTTNERLKIQVIRLSIDPSPAHYLFVSVTPRPRRLRVLEDIV
jgi:hypothetical protein